MTQSSGAGWSLKMVVWRDDQQLQVVEFDHSPISIGALPTNDVVLDHPTVSGQHATLAVSGQALRFRDHSSNGSLLNDRPVEEAVLAAGDRLTIPPFDITFELTVVTAPRHTILRPLFASPNFGDETLGWKEGMEVADSGSSRSPRSPEPGPPARSDSLGIEHSEMGGASTPPRASTPLGVRPYPIERNPAHLESRPRPAEDSSLAKGRIQPEDGGAEKRWSSSGESPRPTPPRVVPGPPEPAYPARTEPSRGGAEGSYGDPRHRSSSYDVEPHEPSVGPGQWRHRREDAPPASLDAPFPRDKGPQEFGTWPQQPGELRQAPEIPPIPRSPDAAPSSGEAPGAPSRAHPAPGETPGVEREEVAAVAKTVRLTVDMMPRWQLVVEEGAGETIGRTVDLAMGKHRIGRAVEAEYRFECTTVSRFHLSISVEPDKVEVQDLGSANGTSVNGRDVVKAELRAGDRIVLGKQLRLGLKRQGETLPPVPQQSSPDSSPGQGAGSQEDDSLPSLPNIQAPELHFRASRSMYNDQVVVVLIEGRVDAYTYPELNEKLEQAITSGERFLVLDLSALRFIDHTGLGVIVKIATSLDRYGGQLRLIGLKDQRLIDTFKLSRLDSFFSGRIAASEERAVADMARYLRGR